MWPERDRGKQKYVLGYFWRISRAMAERLLRNACRIKTYKGNIEMISYRNHPSRSLSFSLAQIPVSVFVLVLYSTHNTFM
jgi:hypothetical protein